MTMGLSPFQDRQALPFYLAILPQPRLSRLAFYSPGTKRERAGGRGCLVGILFHQHQRTRQGPFFYHTEVDPSAFSFNTQHYFLIGHGPDVLEIKKSSRN